MVRGIRAFVLRDLVDEGPALPQRPWLGRVVPRLLEARHTVRFRGRRGCDATGSTSWFGNVKLFLGRLASAVHVQDERAFITTNFAVGVGVGGRELFGLHLTAPGRHLAPAAKFERR